MLIIGLRRVCDREDGKRDYVYQVQINKKFLSVGKVFGHDPKEGWEGLIKDLAESRIPALYNWWEVLDEEYKNEVL